MLSARWLAGCLLAGLLPACGEETEACSTDGYPAAPPGVSAVVHVSAGCPSEGADGSASKPFSQIQQGLDAVASGGAVLVNRGTYPENLKITKPVQVIADRHSEQGSWVAMKMQSLVSGRSAFGIS